MTDLEILKLRRVARLTCDGGPLTVGRASKNDIVLPHASVSRSHCVIELANGVARISDLGSRRGTRVNGEKVREADIAAGDRIRIGPFELTLRERADGSGPSLFDGNTAVPLELEGATAVVTDEEETEAAPRPAAPAPKAAPKAAPLPDEESLLMQRDLARREAAVAARERATDERDEAVTRRERAVDEKERDVQERSDALQRQEEAVVTRIEELDHRTAELLSLRRTAERELSDARAAGRQTDATRAEREREVDELRAVLDAARAEGEALRRRAEAAEAAAAELSDCRRSAETERDARSRLEGVHERLRGAMERLTALQRSLHDLETVWAETDEWVAEAELGTLDEARTRQVLEQRDAVGERLAAAHAHRDELLVEIHEIVDEDG